MGKGDRKTAKGKRFNASYGNVRPKTLLNTGGSAVTQKPVAGKKIARKTAA